MTNDDDERKGKVEDETPLGRLAKDYCGGPLTFPEAEEDSKKESDT